MDAMGQDKHVKDPFHRWISSTVLLSQETRKKRIELDSDYSRGRRVPMHEDFFLEVMNS